MAFDEEYYSRGSARLGFYTSYEWADRAEEFRALAERMHLLFAPTRVLDIGCAKGFLVAALHERGIEALGVDISLYALTKAEANALALVDLNDGALPFSGNKFDLVTAMGTLEYLRDDNPILEEAHRVLKPGGALVWKGLARAIHDDVLVNTHSPADWRRHIAEHGFRFERRPSRHLHLHDHRWQIDRLPASWKATVFRIGYRSPLRRPLLWFYDRRSSGPNTFLVFRRL
jgi:SAM-dependent methyltransferase